jgi:hypothetical protein
MGVELPYNIPVCLLLESMDWINPLNAELNPICHLLAFAAAPYIYDSRLRVKHLVHLSCDNRVLILSAVVEVTVTLKCQNFMFILHK